jgi:tRNA-dihydrouridine synthase B
MLKLGRLDLEVPFFQASLSGYSDYAMRKLAKTYGAPLTFGGCLLDKSVLHFANDGIGLRPRGDEHPIGAQILGRDPVTMSQAAKTLVGLGYDLIDLNFACPAPKVLRRQRGGHLLNEPARIMEIYHRVRESVDCPVLMKLRFCFDDTADSRDKFWQIVEQACDAGVDALIVHPRSVLQRFRGSADWSVLAELKCRFPKAIIIGSGDLFDVRTIAERIRNTGVDGVVIARGAVGTPWIFRDLTAIYEGKSLPPPPGLSEQGQVVLKHFELMAGLYEPKKVINRFRKFILAYCRLHPQRRKAQKSLFAAKDRGQLFAAIEQWYGVS